MKNERFIWIRDFLGFSQAELAEKLDFSQGKIRDIELGKNKISPEVALKLLEKFGINTEYTLFGKLPMLEKDKEVKTLIMLKNKYNLTSDQLEFIVELLNNKPKLQAIISLMSIIKEC